MFLVLYLHLFCKFEVIKNKVAFLGTPGTARVLFHYGPGTSFVRWLLRKL